VLELEEEDPDPLKSHF